MPSVRSSVLPHGPLAVTMGEPAGIGAEIAVKAWAARKRDEGVPPFFFLGDMALICERARLARHDVPFALIDDPEDVVDAFQEALPVLDLALVNPSTPGELDPANAGPVIEAIDRACAFALAGRISGMVTNPIHKRALYDAGFSAPGHTEYLAGLTGARQPVMMLSCPGLRVVPVTVHIPLGDVAGSLTTEAIVMQGRILAEGLIRDFGVKEPRIAVAGLNPHAGEEGKLGHEEQAIITPAIHQLQAEGIHIDGPYPADTLFHAQARTRYDAVLCMYHDQALIPLKTIDFERGVNTTLGLPIVRTSPDHGTALGIAAQGIAHPGSLIAALREAAFIAQNRALHEAGE